MKQHKPRLFLTHSAPGRSGRGRFVFVLLCMGFALLFAACTEEEPYEENRPIDDNHHSNNVVPLTGHINSLFSVSPTLQVYFSQGNLQYSLSGYHKVATGRNEVGTWRFADHQYDVLGPENCNISASNKNYIDLFAWGTSGWNGGVTNYMPFANSGDNRQFFVGGSESTNLTGFFSKADWGVYNAISNGGDEPNVWRTLTTQEWFYLTTQRPNAAGKMGAAIVNDVCGIVLLPDEWHQPSSCGFNSLATAIWNVETQWYAYNEWNSYEKNYSQNIYTAAQWKVMENNGAVFLPAAGFRIGTVVYGYRGLGYYWSSSAQINGGAYFLYFSETGLGPTYKDDRFAGRAVRLVRDKGGE